MERTFMQLLKREFEVAFAKHAQPIGFRIAKYVVLGVLLYFFWGTQFLWITLACLFAIALPVHLWYRHKTHGWTKSYGMWDYEKNQPKGK